MLLNRTDDAEPSTTRRRILKTGLAISAIGISGAATESVHGNNTTETDANGDDSETHTLTVALIDSRDAGVVSGEVTIGKQTKTTTPLNGDPARIQAEFELEHGTYTGSGTSEINDETWHTKEKEVTIDGEDEYLSLVLYPPGSDELTDDESEVTETNDKTGSNESSDESNQTDGIEDDPSDDTATNTEDSKRSECDEERTSDTSDCEETDASSEQPDCEETNE